MPRSTWSGVISFGPMAAPIKLYKATEDKGLKLTLAHKDCGGSVGNLRFCKTCETHNPDTVHSYQLDKESQIILTDEELATLPLESTKRIDIEGFLLQEDHPLALYSDTSHYIVAQEGGAKAFELIVKAMLTRNLVAVGTFTTRGKERHCVIRPMVDGRVVLNTLFSKNEVRDDPFYYTGTSILGDSFSKEELELTGQLLEAMVLPGYFPDDNEDKYKEALHKLIQAKLSGKPIEAPAPAPVSQGSLVDGLKAAIEAAKEVQNVS